MPPQERKNRKAAEIMVDKRGFSVIIAFAVTAKTEYARVLE